MNCQKIEELKDSVIAIGIATYHENELEPRFFSGTGFFISPDGLILTAAHVVKTIKSLLKDERDKNVIFYLSSKNNDLTWYILPVEFGMIISTRIPETTLVYAAPHDLDIGFLKIKAKDRVPYLNVMEKKPDLYQEIVMCGYPEPSTSLKIIQNTISGIRYSPVSQFGRISAFLPLDSHPNPYGIQTDLIGTGGSSGSPIVTRESCEVVGLAQQIIPTFTDLSYYTQSIMAQIGLTFGISNMVIKQISDNVKEGISRGEISAEKKLIQEKYQLGTTTMGSLGKFEFKVVDSYQKI